MRPAVERRALRPIYRYSVIRGGAYAIEELRDALLADRVAAAHYADFQLAHARVVIAPGPRLMYASYRMGDSVYWTRHPVHIAAGEALLTDGVNLARARCGNRLSDTRREPAHAAEPAEREMETTEPAVNILSLDHSALAFDYFTSPLPLVPEEDAEDTPKTFQEYPYSASWPDNLPMPEIFTSDLKASINDDNTAATPLQPVQPTGDAAPEPFAGALICIGLAGVYWMRRRFQPDRER